MKQYSRPIGIHVRLNHGLQDIIQSVEKLKLSIAQSFLLTESNAYIPLDNTIISDFIKAKRDQKFLYFVHAAYWSGLTDVKSKMFISLQREIEITRDLQADGIVIHIGASKHGLSKRDQVAYVVESVNTLLYTSDVTILLENSPHAGRSFGGDLDDLALVLQQVDKKNQIKFCIDTAHAFVYGYDIAKSELMIDFIHLVDKTLGKENIGLIHLNDSQDHCASYIDKHEVPGQGLLGKRILQLCMNHEFFKDIPIIIEVPGSSKQNFSEIIETVYSWEE